MIRKMKVCNICNHKYDNKIPHYCSICGKNLSNQIEKTDIILFLSNFLKIIGIMGLFIFALPLVSCTIKPVSIDGSCFGCDYSIIGWVLIVLPIIFIVAGFILKSYFKKLCLKNIK